MDVRARLRRMIKNEQSILDLQQNGIRGIGTEQTAAYEIESDAIAEAKRRVAMYEMLLADLEKL
ncbi:MULTISPECIES: hypothetical protein [unclassified Shinella]|jgi:hypothetical protein|uniref:hypothetical protein n=1 Tax=unclassified Shinella TaxID=2643062 RepID=UPI000437B4F5|nr:MULTISPECIES: hypothetical protein [unclassified Shinella]MCA0345063.1 hypothetical protein [Pseudomonadota bacterium]EYR80206.1 hypothetical protein SHLA_25c000180 [Shinella sp. DD12]MCO5148713.1 hypothetical protein [Shinella sp.]MDC7264774.1 hypothetical protein [Shinella sp. HY16]MDC7271671.1 hypothetical protein [Shinella sp. YZ44]